MVKRHVFQLFVTQDSSPKNWLKWAKFEESLSHYDVTRRIYEECIESLKEHIDQNVYVSFAKFETRMKDFDRARTIY